MQPKKQEIFHHFLVFRLHTLIFSFISSGVPLILYGVLHIVVIRIVQQPFLLINHLSLTPVLLLYLIHISKLLFDLHYPGSLTASNLTLGGSFYDSLLFIYGWQRFEYNACLIIFNKFLLSLIFKFINQRNI